MEHWLRRSAASRHWFLQPGIGENAAAIRERVCEGLGFWGVSIDEPRNSSGENLVSSPEAPVPVRVIRTDEEMMIARAARRLVGESPAKATASNEQRP